MWSDVASVQSTLRISGACEEVQRQMIAGTKTVPVSPAELVGDAHPLLEQLGSAEDLAMTGSVTAAIQFRRVSDLPSLRHFLDEYREQVLVPVELPVIISAFGLAARGELRELLALDERLARDSVIRPFALSSCRVGQRQLSKLRPMRDQRLVQRYLAAIEAGTARGWHTLVYGVSLAMFSLPLRQGLQNYIEQTTRGFIGSAAKSLQLTESDCDALHMEQATHIPCGIELALKGFEVR
jgi:urease accessory protein UreF